MIAEVLLLVDATGLHAGLGTLQQSATERLLHPWHIAPEVCMSSLGSALPCSVSGAVAVSKVSGQRGPNWDGNAGLSA